MHRASLAGVLTDLGDFVEAEQLHRAALDTARQVLPTGHPDTALVANNLGSFLLDQGRRAEAEALLRDAHAAFLERLGPHHPSTRACAENLERTRGAQPREGHRGA